jgi:PelA/Pel-15E family pectate lyase
LSAGDITVAADGSGDVLTVQEAIDRVPENNAKRVVVRIKPGTYRGQLRVPATKPFISLVGGDARRTILTFSISNKEAGSTSAAYATYIGGHDFRAENVTFENSFGQGSQAVAALVDADRVVFIKCRFLGWQDTLYAKTGRQYYRDCYIEGHVDFIFGQASAIFDRCTIHSKADGYITAPMRFAPDEPSGLIFRDSRLTAENTKTGVFLGRPWRDYGRTVFIDTQMGGHVRPEGWHHWLPEREKTAFMAEYRSHGKGSNPNARAKWSRQLDGKEVKHFSIQAFLKGTDGWDPRRAEDKWLKTRPQIKTVSWGEALKQTPTWYQTDEAARIADQVLLYQKANGGWEKNIDYAAMLTEQEKTALAAKRTDVSETTIDNRTSYTHIAYLAKVITASMLKSSPPTNFLKYKEAFTRGLNYLLLSQYDNGGFPQYFPLKKGYYTHITFNDDAMVGVLRVLRDIAGKQDDYKFVDENERAKASRAVAKGLALILKLQVETAGILTGWSQQYDEVTLKPAWARKFEPPCLASAESVGIVRFLMQEKPTREIIGAVEGAVSWLRKTQLSGVRWLRTNGDNAVVKDEKAPAIWARFYEFETMKPIFIGRDSVIKYDVSQIEAERRNGYAWYGDWARDLLEKDYPKWKARLGTDKQ